jgi:glycerol-3-phosphate cytidylyltransferase
MKFVQRADIAALAVQLRSQGQKIVFTNGCFDILHVGHVRYLNAARELGDCLIVGLNNDASVRQLKGPTRPVNDEADRAEVLAGLTAVSYVVVFSEETAENLVAEIRPAIYAKGGDYSVDRLPPEAKIVAAHGGQTVFLPEVAGRSTTNIIRKMASV